jgi:hypothetical protein
VLEPPTELEPDVTHWKIGGEEVESDETGVRKTPQPGIFRKIAFVVVFVLLFSTPALLLLAAVSANCPLRGILAQTTAFWFPVWAVFAVWVTLDSSALFGFVGPRPDPLGHKALRPVSTWSCEHRGDVPVSISDKGKIAALIAGFDLRGSSRRSLLVGNTALWEGGLCFVCCSNNQ